MNMVSPEGKEATEKDPSAFQFQDESMKSCL